MHFSLYKTRSKMYFFRNMHLSFTSHCNPFLSLCIKFNRISNIIYNLLYEIIYTHLLRTLNITYDILITNFHDFFIHENYSLINNIYSQITYGILYSSCYSDYCFSLALQFFLFHLLAPSSLPCFNEPRVTFWTFLSFGYTFALFLLSNKILKR